MQQRIDILTELSRKPKTKPQGELGFGVHFSDHIFVCDYARGEGWHSPEVIPYDKFEIDPGASVLHYGQALFEGMKAFRQKGGETVLFRPEFNHARMKEGAERLCMEMPSKNLFIEGIKHLVRTDLDWVPTAPGSSLYLRPTLIGTEPFLGVRPSDQYRFFVLASPVGAYYKEGLGPVKIWVEENYIRAAPGGLGATKAAANYAASLRASQEAKKNGFSQVLWLDVSREYVEEVGTMNVFFVIDGEVHTPALDGTILGGCIRNSTIHLLRDQGVKVFERKIKWSELVEASAAGTLTEAFGTGTAAVISPIGEFTRGSSVINLAQVSKPFQLAQKLYSQITGIQYGEQVDPYGWTTCI